ncbi:MAG: 2-oxoacid:acceptor oxidoreductase family protein [Candidatus Aminicenantes bacterium]|jgi:pyruvate ferredoxin oxidoreductase gamma subunit|nr:2-oxoacid:acceptor oxidoreductase family protein [Candidatus Aminicenantes bacterium]MDH5386717.1 2-oxoacid:acceptor oxidoreductase family protein [Candidatus Aminicenantes bacterium]
MDKETIEIRWHGRAGQGVVTAAATLADVISTEEDLHVQAFPEFGAEKRGAPILAFNRISKKPIRSHSQVYYPDIVVVTDPSLLGMVDVTSGAKEDAIFLMNTTFDIDLVRKRLSLGEKKIYSLDAYSIAEQELGRAIPNVPMVSALIKVTGLMDLDKFKKNIRVSLGKKLRPEVVEKNMRTIDRAFEEVKER